MAKFPHGIDLREVRGKGDLELRWEVDDGYAGGAAPQRLTLCGSDIDECADQEELDQLIEEEVKEAKDQLGWTVTGWSHK